MGEVVIGARSAGGDDEESGGRRPEPSPGEPGGPPPPRDGGAQPPGDQPLTPDEESAAPSAEAPEAPEVSEAPESAEAAGAGVPVEPKSAPDEEQDEADGEGGDKGRDKAGAEKKKRSFWVELPLLIAIALVLALIIKTFFVQAFSIPSGSMEDTAKIGDRVLVDKLTPWFGSKPDRGEVVVFHDPGGWLTEAPSRPSNPVVRGLQDALAFVGLMPDPSEKDLIKRVIGVGGDHVVCCDVNGKITVNGHPLDEPYLKPGVVPSTQSFDIVVPKGRMWLMGDNRANSADSRYHMYNGFDGTVSTSDAVGRAFAVVWPLNRIHWLGVPSTFGQPGLGAMGVGEAPFLLGLAGAVPLVLWRRRFLDRLESGTMQAVPTAPPR